MAKPEIELVNRGDGVIIPLHPTDPIVTEDKPQRRLAELYRVYDLKCCCVEGGVLMHIRQIDKLSLYYVADNPTSPMHSEQCPLATSRLGISQSEAKDYIPGPITEFTLAAQQSASESQAMTTRKRSSCTPPHMRQSYLLILTLVRNAFLNVSFGRYRSLQDFAKAIINSEKKIQLNGSTTGQPVTVNELLSFGPGGFKIAQNKAAIHGCAFWLSYSAELKCNPTSITIYDNEHKTRITRPYVVEGPHIQLSILNKEGFIKEVVVQPVLSGTYVLPIFSSNDRENDIKGELQSVFKANNGSKNPQWISVELWGGDNHPGAIYHVEKLPSGNRTCRLINPTSIRSDCHESKKIGAGKQI